jgi:hypothetical protein
MSEEYPHGTYAGYNRGCRCDDCRAARYLYWQAWNEHARATSSAEHGTYNRYRTYRCRCDLCRKAVREYERERRAARRQATA